MPMKCWTVVPEPHGLLSGYLAYDAQRMTASHLRAEPGQQRNRHCPYNRTIALLLPANRHKTLRA